MKHLFITSTSILYKIPFYLTNIYIYIFILIFFIIHKMYILYLYLKFIIYRFNKINNTNYK